MRTWVVVPSNGRPFIRECLAAIHPQVDGIVVVANGDSRDCLAPYVDMFDRIVVAPDPSSEMNISRWWNIGLDVVSGMMAEGDHWNALVLNDDAFAPHNFVSHIGEALRSCSAAIAFPNQHDSHRAFWKTPGPVNLFWRITGYAFMMRGELGLRFDENLVWWYGDDDLDWRAREQGGSLLVPGCPVEHRAPNGTMAVRPELHVQAGRDRETFVKKWGMAPW